MRTKYYFGALFLAISALLLNSCEFFNCLEGNGNTISEQRIVASFTGVENSTSFNVKVIADTVYSVEVTADENLLPFIETYVRSDNLIIATGNQCINPARPVRIEVHLPVLEYIELSGSGDIDVFDVEGADFKIRSSGSGDIDLNSLYLTSEIEILLYGSGDILINGKANIGNYGLFGSGDILADDLQVDSCYVTSSGSGDVYCFVYDLLDVEINGSGDVLYSGNPEIVLDDNGSGDLIERN